MPHPCPPGKIRDPVTNRCVKTSKSMKTLKMEIVQEILNFLPPTETNLSCGQFVRIMKNRYGNLDGVIEELRFSVVKSLRAFSYLLRRSQSRIIVHSSMDGDVYTIEDVEDAILIAENADTATKLVNLCKRIAEWKREASLIVEIFGRVLSRVEIAVRTTGLISLDILGNFVSGHDMIFMINNRPFRRSFWTSQLPIWRDDLEHEQRVLQELLLPLHTSVRGFSTQHDRYIEKSR